MEEEQVEARRCLLNSNEKVLCVFVTQSVRIVVSVIHLACGGILTGHRANPSHPDVVLGAKEIFTGDEKGHPIYQRGCGC